MTKPMEAVPKKSVQSTLLELNDHSKLLDVIDLLRSQGVHHYVSIPQIIVCGDQSSGKSSVLNALSGFELPTKEGLCTRFAIELILRRSLDVKVSITITPGADRTPDEKGRITQFQYPNANLDDLPDIVEKAKEAMGIGPDGKTLSDDVLRIEYSGPEQPNLTLVDLPGVIHSNSKQQSAEDVRLISKLVKDYMSNRRSIILAVVSAKNDYANQIITKLAHEVDPRGQRTLGIITKPDKLPEGSESEKLFFELAKNEQVVFRLGWHVLKNRDWNERDISTEARDESERLFFSRGVWTMLPSDCLGVSSLIPRLSSVLRDHIVAELPNLILDVESGIEECNARLLKLGGSRVTDGEQRLYLISLSRSFERLVKEAVDGNYNDDFFGDAKTKAGFSKRLRAAVQDCLTRFDEDIHRKGHAKKIVEDGKIWKEDPKQVSREDYLKGVKELLRTSRGRALPGLFDPMVIADLFFEQSKPWRKIVDTYRAKILEAVAIGIDFVVNYIADKSTRDGLDRHIIGPAKEIYAQRFQKKINEIMKPHMKGHPITYNHYFTDTIRKMEEERFKKNAGTQLMSFFSLPSNADYNHQFKKPVTIGSLATAVTKCYQMDMDHQASSNATDAMQAYYKVALKTLIDNFATLATEFCVIETLWTIFTPETVLALSDAQVKEIAAETKESQTERNKATKKLESLQQGLITLKSLHHHRVQASSSDEEFEDSASDMSFEEDGSTVSKDTNPGLEEPELSKSAPCPVAEIDEDADIEGDEAVAIDAVESPEHPPTKLKYDWDLGTPKSTTKRRLGPK